MGPKIVVDLAPAGGRHGERGIGRYVRGMASAVAKLGDDLVGGIWVVGERGPVVAPFLPRVVSPRSGGITGRFPESARRLLAMREAVARSGAIAVHATDPQRPCIPRTDLTVVTVYDLIPLRERALLQSWRADHRLVYRRYLDQIARAAHVVAISQATAADVHERLGVPSHRIHVVYPWVAPPPTAPDARSPDGGVPTFLVVGALDQHKQPELALGAFALVRARLTARLRFIGPGDADQRQRLRQLSRQLGVADSVSIEQRIPDSELELAYRSAVALVSTSRLEGFGLPPVEALLRGTPVVAVDTPTARETIGGLGTILPPDPEAIATAMLDPRRPTPAEIRDLESRFGLDRMARSMSDLYGQIRSGPIS